jgi:hypothetical protein
MRIRVEAHAGYQADESPLRFWLGEQRIEVAEIVDRWRGEDADHFRVLGDDGHTYVLKCLRGPDGAGRWEMASFTDKHSHGTEPDVPGGSKVLQ